MLADLIADFISSNATNAFISIIQAINKGRHDFGIADAIITVAELTQGSASLTSIASRLRGVDQLGDFAGISIAALGRGAAGGTGSRWSATAGTGSGNAAGRSS